MVKLPQKCEKCGRSRYHYGACGCAPRPVESSFVGTPEGVVIRHTGPTSASAWRLNSDGSWSRALDLDATRWLSAPPIEVPVSILHAIQDLRAALSDGTKQTAQPEGK